MSDTPTGFQKTIIETSQLQVEKHGERIILINKETGDRREVCADATYGFVFFDA